MTERDEAAQWLSGLLGRQPATEDAVEPEPESTQPRPDLSQGATGEAGDMSSETMFREWLQDGALRRWRP